MFFFGFRKELVSAQPVDPSAIDLDSINNRLSELAKNKFSKPYGKQKSSLHRELLSVLAFLTTPKTLHSGTPGDILRGCPPKNVEGKFRTFNDWPHFFSESQTYPMYKYHIYLDLFELFHFLRDGFQGDLKTG